MVKIKPDKIIRSKRRSVALMITSDAMLVVRAPLFTPFDYIQKLIDKKTSWINKKIEELQSKPKVLPKEFVSGEGYLFLGKMYKLKFTEDKSIELHNSLMFPKSSLSTARDELINWYKKQASEKISERVDWYTKIMGLNFTKIQITSAQRRWGSCGPKGTLNFNWRLIMAPLQIINYVVVHELAHLTEKSHSRKFWNRVRVILPDYRQRLGWLKENCNQLII